MRLGSRRHRSGALPLDGRVAVVTGAARGVGESTAWALSRRGARVALLGLEGDRLRRLAEDLPGPAAGFPVDVTDADALAAVAQDVREVLGVVSVVVANAGVAIGGPLLDCEPEDWRRVIEVNIVGSALTARCFLPDLLRSHGYYLQVASLPALAPAPFLTAYRASKSGVEALAHALRAEITHRGVDVGIAYLHWADTTLIRHADQTAVFQELRSHMPWPASVNQDPAAYAAAMVRGIEHRSAHVYAPPWLRPAQVVRAVTPSVVVQYFRWALAARGDDALPPAIAYQVEKRLAELGDAAPAHEKARGEMLVFGSPRPWRRTPRRRRSTCASTGIRTGRAWRRRSAGGRAPPATGARWCGAGRNCRSKPWRTSRRP